MDFSGEQILFVVSILVFVAVMAGKVSYRYGTPALLLFLGVGVLFGYSLVPFYSPEMTQFIGMTALCIILFTGGMQTSFKHIRPVLGPGIVLSTLGVILTAVFCGCFIYVMAPQFGVELPMAVSLLLAAMMSSTDSASVFSILRTKKQGLKESLRPLLELESGSNDPVAYVLVIVLIDALRHSQDISILSLVSVFVFQMMAGALSGFGFGKLAVWTINRFGINNKSLYSVLLLAFVFFTFSFTSLIKGNGYLAIYIAGLVVGNSKVAHRRTMSMFFDGLTWLLQILMFVTLGLLVNLEELFDLRIILFAVSVSFFMILIARPASVLISLAPFRKFSTKARFYISWVGLRGAVPIIFATYPIVEDIPWGRELFNIVFVSTVISLLIQGTTVSSLAELLGISYVEKEGTFAVGAMQDSIDSEFTEVEVNQNMIAQGNMVKDIKLPDNTLIVMINKNGKYMVPQGNTTVEIGDKLLVLTENSSALEEQYEHFGVDDVIKF